MEQNTDAVIVFLEKQCEELREAKQAAHNILERVWVEESLFAGLIEKRKQEVAVMEKDPGDWKSLTESNEKTFVENVGLDFSKVTAAEAVVNYLKYEGKPCSLKEVINGMKAGGLISRAKDFPKLIRTRLYYAHSKLVKRHEATDTMPIMYEYIG